MEYGESEDQVLLKKIKAGDESSFRKIYLKYHKKLYRVALKYLRGKSLAEDAVHDIFVKLWDNRKKLKTSGSLKGFLFTSIKNHVLNVIDKDKRRVKKHIKLSYERKIKNMERDNVIALSEYRSFYQSAVEQLPEKRRKVFELRTSDGLTNREVAEYMEISIHTVKSQYYKASTFIKEYVHQHMKRETGS
jgi:RNA polymerase sigma-70 factor (ECF subfamily)